MNNNLFNDFTLENIAKGVQDAVNNVTEKVEETLGNPTKTYVGKVQANAKLSSLYEKLGKAHYMTATGQVDMRKDIAKLMEEISDIHDDLADAENSTNDGLIRCSVCKKKNPSSSKFCSRCGAKLNDNTTGTEDK